MGVDTHKAFAELWAEALSILAGDNERLNHLGVGEVAVELVQLAQPEVVTGVVVQEAIEFHIEGLCENGQAIPEPTSSVEYVEVRAA